MQDGDIAQLDLCWFVLETHAGMKWIKLILPCTFVVKDAEGNAAIKKGLVIML